MIECAQGAPANLPPKKDRGSTDQTAKGGNYRCLPTITIPKTLSPSDAKALDIVSQASVIPVTKEIFPNYKTRSILESQIPISAWTVKDYQAIVQLKGLSERLRQLTVNQFSRMDQIFGSVNNHGGYNGLQHRAEGIPEQSTAITVSADSADSLLAAAPSSWTKIISRTKSLRGSLVDGYEIAELKKSFGEAQTNAVLKSFDDREREKGRPHEVWNFGLPEDGWEDKT